MKKEEIKSKLLEMAIEHTEEGVFVKRIFDKEVEFIQQYADQQSIAFAEWVTDNVFSSDEANDIFGYLINKGQWLITSEKEDDKILTTTELLQIFKNDNNEKNI